MWTSRSSLRFRLPGPQDAALALCHVGRTPGAVQVVQGDRAVLDVGADSHLLGAAEQDGDAPGAAGREQLAFVAVGLGFVDEPDHAGRHAAGSELVAQFLVDVPVVSRGCRCRRKPAAGCL